MKLAGQVIDIHKYYDLGTIVVKALRASRWISLKGISWPSWGRREAARARC